MAYTPELSYGNSCVLRRIAWSLGKPMTYTMQWVFEELARTLNSEEICKACKKIHQSAVHVHSIVNDNMWRGSLPSLIIRPEVIK